jgi:phospholipid-translocating ATPase
MASLARNQSEVSLPVNRIRWATRRENEEGGSRRRRSILRRLRHRPKQSSDTNQTPQANNTADNSAAASAKESRSSDETSATQQLAEKRTVYFNVPLPDDARDEQGRPKQYYSRNKIRTAKYTPISFIPKNLWFQFHNVANLYFAFIIVLGVSSPSVSFFTTF